jgi:cobalamin-dependent methionine synthase I
VRQRVQWTAAESLPARADVLRLQGIGDDVEVPVRIDILLDKAIDRYLALTEPRAILASISIAEFERLYQGDGHNAPDTPLEQVYPRASRLALTAATVGAGVSAAVVDLFDQRDVALGCMLDAVASAAADRLADLLAERFAAGGGDNLRVLPYSPGYCGWHVSGQRALFRRLQPEEIGILLNTSCLMQPLKSVSAVLVGGAADIHKFRPTYSFCDPCQDKHCRGRMASVLKA